jgi:hypothetical protein
MARTKLGLTSTPAANLGTAAPNPPPGLATQVVSEAAWQGTPDAVATQIVAESAWSGAPTAYATQILVEIVFPFECTTPTPSNPCPDLPDVCPVPREAASSPNSCDAGVPSAGASVAGCVAPVPKEDTCT